MYVYMYIPKIIINEKGNEFESLGGIWESLKGGKERH